MTWSAGRAITLSDEEFLLIRELVHEFCGILLPDSMHFLVERRLQPRLPVHGLSNFREYYRMVKYGGCNSAEFDEIVERITTNETYFFREAYQLKAFTDELLPHILDNRSAGDRIRIWSAGCSSGEEPYSIAMLLAEIPQARAFKFDIFGNDISKKVLRAARGATYRASAFRQTEQHYIDKYFRKVETGVFRISDHIRNQVTFGHLNLVDEAAMALVANVDVIFCRNVMIYFGAESRARLLDSFHRRARAGGFLLLGHSESLVNVSTDFELVPLKNDIVYRKPQPESVDSVKRARTVTKS